MGIDVYLSPQQTRLLPQYTRLFALERILAQLETEIPDVKSPQSLSTSAIQHYMLDRSKAAMPT
jgi:hypothetical protein